MATTLRLPVKGRKIAAKPVSRRGVVDTNLLSYDRTDPFCAINALRKLLGSLASRVGSCQYKFTHDEHRLSLHLLTIVEPFVRLSPSSRTLTRQPTEILDAIAFHIDSKRDLLALALSCRRMHDIIFPRHSDYRFICAKVSSVAVWNHLIVNQSLARNVRTLEIIDERAHKALLLPSPINSPDTDTEPTDDGLTMHSKQERRLVGALTNMTALRSFNCDNLIFGPYTPGDTIEAANTGSVLPYLKAVTLQSTKHVYGSSKTPGLRRISGMLTSCPNLESLDIEYEHRRAPGQQLPAADDFFLCSRWPSLRSLSLTNLRCSSAQSLESAAAFLNSHVNLEVLHLDFPMDRSGSGGEPALRLPANSLPKLRELKSGRSIATSILSCPCDNPRPLETIKGVKLSGLPWDQPFLTNLKANGGTVKRLETASWNGVEDIQRLVECVPTLTWLDVHKHADVLNSPQSNHGRRTECLGRLGIAAAPATNVAEWATMLAPLADLTTFFGVKFFYEVPNSTLAVLAAQPTAKLSVSELSRVRKNEKIANILANKCPKLRRLDHWEDAGGKVIVLSREGNEVKWEVKKLKT
ncbi:hypothetical protein F5I97DRAFT_1928836 [Phlebopus sp. FC_14]|nr:hypothetical protein F5I97DRAFT_1928836 [Phlebopus sp. FC_14]